jgi:hypothetical protein
LGKGSALIITLSNEVVLVTTTALLATARSFPKVAH